MCPNYYFDDSVESEEFYFEMGDQIEKIAEQQEQETLTRLGFIHFI